LQYIFLINLFIKNSKKSDIAKIYYTMDGLIFDTHSGNHYIIPSLIKYVYIHKKVTKLQKLNILIILDKKISNIIIIFSYILSYFYYIHSTEALYL